MLMTFTPETWVLRTPSGGCVEVLDETHVKLFGDALSYTALDREILIEPGWVSVDAACHTQGLADPCTAATVMLSLLDGEGNAIRRQYVDAVPGDAPGSVCFCRILEVPEGITRGVVTLAVRWPRGGHAVFTPPSVAKAEAPPKRSANIAVTYFKPFQGGDFYQRIPELIKRIDAPDFVVLSESLHCRSLGGTIANRSEALDGPYISMLSGLASQYNTYIAANLNVAEGSEFFNTTVLLDRAGSLVGTYRKVHLPLSEVEDGLSPGSEYPVFETDFAKVGLTICWDAAFPEAARNLRLNGAELMVSSTLGDFWPQDMARCKDNGLWFAIAGAGNYSGNPPPSRVIDPLGSLLCSCGGGDDDVFAAVNIDFTKRFFKKWMSVGPGEGEPVSLMVVERRPETYFG